MKHRIANTTCFGDLQPVFLDNKGSIDELFAEDVLKSYFKKHEGLDFSIKDMSVDVGIEPTYQYDKLKIISINKIKGDSYLLDGIARGSYGTQISKTIRYYKDYKNKCKFINFVDKWHSVLFGEVK